MAEQMYTVLTERGYSIKVPATSPDNAMSKVSQMGHTAVSATLDTGILQFQPLGGGETEVTKEISAAGEELLSKFVTQHTQGEKDDYAAYLEFLKTETGQYWPTPKNIEDFLENYTTWAYEKQREFKIWTDYFQTYGKTGEWRPIDIDDFYANYSKAQELLTTWQGMAEEKEAEFTDDQRREFNQWMSYYNKWADIADWRPVDIEDYFSNREQAQGLLDVWTRKEQVAGEYEVSPVEAARRQEEAYQESRYAAQERYRETPMLGEHFSAWMAEQKDMSGAFQQFTESQFPSLRGQFEAQIGPTPGFPTREEARAYAGAVEEKWKGWLPRATPELEQKYWAQPASMRGERFGEYSPSLQYVNW